MLNLQAKQIVRMSYLNKLLIVVVAVLVLVGFNFAAQEMTDTSVEVAGTNMEVSGVATSTVARVAYVIDGDTIEIASGERVRLLGVDTPEMDECYYQEATNFARDVMNGRAVRLEADVTDRDQYGRLLRQVFVADETGEETHVNYELVARGYAEVLPIPPDRAYREAFRAAEAAASAAARGRHGVCSGG